MSGREHPHVGRALRREFGDWRQWGTRALVIAAAGVCGLAIVGFAWLTEFASALFGQLRAAWWWAPLLWTPLVTAGVVALTRRYMPGAAGSGIPQVMAALDASVDAPRRGLYVSLRLSLGKVLLTAGGLLGGLSLGREGPSVQVAAGLMLAASRWLPRRAQVTEHGLLVAGGAAGMAAAFNAPLAGVMFAIEELSRTPEQRSSGLLIGGIVFAGVMAVSVSGNATYFGVIHASAIGVALLWPALIVALAAGLAGGLFARLVAVSLTRPPRHAIGRLRAAHPVLFAALCGLGVAALGVASDGAVFGSGYGTTRGMLEGMVAVPLLFVAGKFLATWLTTWSGAPAGIFAPSLAIGAALGNDVARFMHVTPETTLIALGMVGFLAAVTQAPLTAFIIVMEMVDGHAMVLSLMACALIASGVSRLLSAPLYPTLARAQLQRLPPPDPAPNP